ncbi:MAG: TraR/DksA family transcriptional regulator [Syntrophorhabdaceae bacterium]|nr:TraR/DksA family transcriptional regulator [Syntrophorhabdaceae bacterium]MDD4196700.1 TraR/DksA family transcriptional regulator [Syntrophorhabdaceae bacterium]
MLSPKEIARLKERLVRERDRVFNIHARLREDREDLVAPEVEFEENAQKDGLLEPVSEIDDSQEARLDAITDALEKIESGQYGRCERCGRQIEPKRLDALPWATLCSACQAEAERGPVRGLSEDVELPELPPDLQDLSDDEILRYVLDELQEDGRVDLEELTIECSRGIIHVDGFLPSEAQHQILLEILLDSIGIASLTDHISIDPLLWETDDRTSGKRGPGEEARKALSSDETSDAYVSRTSGASLDVPDELIPEDKPKKRRKT